jgi:hypothetical protein
MFCARCGEQIPDASVLCPLCGREATLNLPPPPAIPAPAAAPALGQIRWPDEPQNFGPPMRRPDLKGVGGWLLFFCIARTVLAPLLIAARVLGRDFNLGIMFELVFTAFGIFVGVMVWTVNTSAFMLLWIYFGVSAAFLLLAMVAASLSGIQGAEQMGQLVWGLAFTIIWFAYFKKSDRVQATFGRNL